MPATAAGLDELLPRLQRQPPSDETFHDVRWRRALARPLVSSGVLRWHGGMDFERRVETPYRETSRLRGRTLVVQRDGGSERIVPLARAPELQALFAGLSALFAGDVEAIEHEFEVELSEQADTWRLRLRPRQARLAERVQELDLRGQGDQLRCLLVQQPGAEVLSVLGAASPPQPVDEDLPTLMARLCPHS